MNKKNVKIFVICDDLTGCGDIAYWALKWDLNFLKQKIIDIASLQKFDVKELKKYNVVILNAESRFDGRKKLIEKIDAISDFLKKDAFYKKFEFIFKKIDSVLRGNFAIETSKLLDNFKIDFTPFIAAYPEYLRFTKGGFHYIGEDLLQNTSFANDPKNPATQSFIPDIILKQLRSRQKLKKFVIYNIENVADLELSAKNILENDYRNIKFYTGTSRFFGEILKQNKKSFHIVKQSSCLNEKKYENFIVVSGTFNEITKLQIQNFRQKHNYLKEYFDRKFKIFTDFERIYLFQSFDIYEKNYSIKNFVKNVWKFLLNKNYKLDKSLFVLTGGETSYNFLRLYDIKDLEIIDKIDTGIVLCRHKNIDFILKPGAFGDKNFLESVYARYFL